MVQVHVAANSLVKAVDQEATLEELPEWYLEKPIEYVLAVADVALKTLAVHRDFQAMFVIRELQHIQWHYVPAAVRAVKVAASLLFQVISTVQLLSAVVPAAATLAYAD